MPKPLLPTWFALKFYLPLDASSFSDAAIFYCRGFLVSALVLTSYRPSPYAEELGELMSTLLQTRWHIRPVWFPSTVKALVLTQDIWKFCQILDLGRLNLFPQSSPCLVFFLPLG